MTRRARSKAAPCEGPGALFGVPENPPSPPEPGPVSSVSDPAPVAEASGPEPGSDLVAGLALQPSADQQLQVDAHTRRCRRCGRIIRWAITFYGRKVPLDHQELRVSYVGPGRPALVFLVANGLGARVFVREDGELVGYESHFSTCPVRRDE